VINVLNVADMMYVVALVSVVSQLLYYVTLVGGRRRNQLVRFPASVPQVRPDQSVERGYLRDVFIGNFFNQIFRRKAWSLPLSPGMPSARRARATGASQASIAVTVTDGLSSR
jgi:hypothetical protein